MNINALIPLLSVLTYVVLIVLALRHPHRRERRAFLLYLTAAGIYSLISFPLFLEEAFLQQHTIMGTKALILAVIWMSVTYYHFIRVFVQKAGGVGVYLGCASLLLVAVLAALDLVPRDAFSAGGKLQIELGPTRYLIGATSLGLVIASYYFLWQHLKQVTSTLVRTRIAYLILGLTVVTLFSTTNLSKTFLSDYPLRNLGNLGNALIISYAILKFQLLDIKFRVKSRFSHRISFEAA